jgi:succinate-semialdehyde dehydrogenase/glutarate-semialdehyde dehydrogenase
MTEAAYPEPRMLIGGEWEDRGPRSPVLDPATGEAIGAMPEADARLVRSAVAAAHLGFAVWRRTPAIDRRRALNEAARLIRARAEAIARVLTREQGKTMAEARAELAGAADAFEWYGDEAVRAYGREVPARRAGVRQAVRREPVGPVAALTPWNFPALTPARKIAGALAAGCSVVIRPSSETPATCMELVRACVDAGVPPGVLNLVFGPPAEVSDELLASPLIRKVTFTGSTAVGKALARRAADGMKRGTFELGGHAPLIVFDDADLDAALDAAVAAKFRNAGQVCIAPSRFLVQEAAYERFVAGLAERAAALRVGPGEDPATQMGPLANERGLAAMDRFVAGATAGGARVVAGGRRIGARGCFWAPTVLRDVPPDAAAMREEVFGPLAPVAPFRDADDALAAANASPYGLAAYAFTGSLRRAHEVAEGLEAGMVGINHFGVSLAELPFGGVKESGWGQEGGAEGIEHFMDVKSVSILA